MDHAYDAKKDGFTSHVIHETRKKNKRNDGNTNDEEYRVLHISDSENKAARALGELGPNQVIRNFHIDGKPTVVANPLSNRIIQDKTKELREREGND